MEWVSLSDLDKSQVKSEFGSSDNINWLNPENAKAYDSEGGIIKCKCGKDAGFVLLGKEGYLAYCSECNPVYKEEDVIIVCEPPKEG